MISYDGDMTAVNYKQKKGCGKCACFFEYVKAASLFKFV